MSLDAAHRAFDAGDFAEARRLAKAQKSAAGTDEATRAAADEILMRTGVDPLVIWFTAGAVLLFVTVVYFGLR
jgi:hypothetical protein